MVVTAHAALTVVSEEAEAGRYWCPACFIYLFFYLIVDPGSGDLPPTLWKTCTVKLNVFDKLPRHTQRCVSMVIIHPIRLRVEIS